LPSTADKQHTTSNSNHQGNTTSKPGGGGNTTTRPPNTGNHTGKQTLPGNNNGKQNGPGNKGTQLNLIVVQPTTVIVRPSIVINRVNIRPRPIIVRRSDNTVVETTGGPSEGEEAYQGVRYLRIKNSSGEKMRVFVQFCVSNAGEDDAWLQTPDESGVMVFNFEDGEEGRLNCKDGPLIGSKVRIWAESASGKTWTKYKDSDLVLVETPYRSDEVATYTFGFNP
jgi:hypothetical protein